MGRKYGRRLKGEGHDAFRAVLRVAGPLLILVGGGMFVAGIISFTRSFDSVGDHSIFGHVLEPRSSAREPSRFWMCFVGMPIAVAGIAATRFAYLGAAARYVAGEVAPVARDTVNYMVDGTKQSIATVGAALRGEQPPPDGVHCPGCDTANDAQARFCDHCGAALPGALACGRCGAPNDPEANYCDECGHPLREG